VFISFAAFLLYNGGIALGDKENHIPVIHIPQLFYCSAFITVFSLPLVFRPRDLMALARIHGGTPWRFLRSVLAVLVILRVIATNTIEHPFLLADNRHFIFYIWRRTVNRTPYSRYLAAPVYYGSLCHNFFVLSKSQKLAFLIMLAAVSTLVLVPAALIEFRYYLLPYFFWRLHIGAPTRTRILVSLHAHTVVNAVSLYLFLSRPFEWSSEPRRLQRFMW